MEHISKIFYTLDKLEEIYHNEACPPELGHDEPLDGLILTVLSQNTNDKNRDAAFTQLKNLYPTWPEVVKAGTKNLEQAIKTAGLGPTKAARIIEILNKIFKDFGEYSIKKLAKLNFHDMRKYLRALPGVGAKTVNCVMLFDFKLPAFPVDTHITRIIKRLDIMPENSSPEDISRFLELIIPDERCLGGHVNIIEHGRKICHSRKPDCKNCVLAEICPSLY